MKTLNSLVDTASSIQATTFFFFLLFIASGNVFANCEYSSPLEVEEYEIGNILKWETSFEKDNEYFIVERSFDGVNFEQAGKVEGAGNSFDNKAYSFLDMQMGKKYFVYRLKQVDFNGNYIYSELKEVNRTVENNVMVLSIASTEVGDLFEFSVDVDEAKEAHCSIVNIQGKIIKTIDKTLISGINHLSFNMSDLPVGTYTFKMNVAQEHETIVLRKTIDSHEEKDTEFAKVNRK